ncbi:uncharacterized protein LOC135847400 [Planococcus citri]|uniref:uncharacterized protein LOC135847400 n=1 Tax=Planococcus citri TaxID=170843 RepID=UPI0031F8084C
MYLACTRKKLPNAPVTAEQVDNSIVKVTPMKRKNFSAEEINFLKTLIQKYRPNQIENKKTDTANLGEKQRIWESITAEFNAHFQNDEETSVKQLRKLWDNLKTRRKNELLRERLVDDDSTSAELKHKLSNSNYDDISDSLDSNAMSVDFPSALDENSYLTNNSPNSWALPIETVIIENESEETYRDTYKDATHHQPDDNFVEPSEAVNNCTCSQTKKEMELRHKKIKLILQEEEALYKMKKDEQQLKNEIAKVQLKIVKEKKAYLAKKRKLQLQILTKQLDNSNRAESNEEVRPKLSNCVADSDESGVDDSKVKINNCVKVEKDSEDISNNCLVANGKLENEVNNLRR